MAGRLCHATWPHPGPGFLYFWTFGSVVPALGFVLLSVLLLVIFPRQVRGDRPAAQRKPVASFGLGCLGLVVAVAVALLPRADHRPGPVSLALLLTAAAAWVLGLDGDPVGDRPGAHRGRAAAGRATRWPALLIGGPRLSLWIVVPVVTCWWG